MKDLRRSIVPWMLMCFVGWLAACLLMRSVIADDHQFERVAAVLSTQLFLAIACLIVLRRSEYREVEWLGGRGTELTASDLASVRDNVENTHGVAGNVLIAAGMIGSAASVVLASAPAGASEQWMVLLLASVPRALSATAFGLYCGILCSLRGHQRSLTIARYSRDSVRQQANAVTPSAPADWLPSAAILREAGLTLERAASRISTVGGGWSESIMPVVSEIQAFRQSASRREKDFETTVAALGSSTTSLCRVVDVIQETTKKWDVQLLGLQKMGERLTKTSNEVATALSALGGPLASVGRSLDEGKKEVIFVNEAANRLASAIVSERVAVVEAANSVRGVVDQLLPSVIQALENQVSSAQTVAQQEASLQARIETLETSLRDVGDQTGRLTLAISSEQQGVMEKHAQYLSKQAEILMTATFDQMALRVQKDLDGIAQQINGLAGTAYGRAYDDAAGFIERRLGNAVSVMWQLNEGLERGAQHLGHVVVDLNNLNGALHTVAERASGATETFRVAATNLADGIEALLERVARTDGTSEASGVLAAMYDAARQLETATKSLSTVYSGIETERVRLQKFSKSVLELARLAAAARDGDVHAEA